MLRAQSRDRLSPHGMEQNFQTDLPLHRTTSVQEIWGEKPRSGRHRLGEEEPSVQRSSGACRCLREKFDSRDLLSCFCTETEIVAPTSSRCSYPNF